MIRRLLAVLPLLLLAVAPARAGERLHRKLTLDNGLKVVLASDPGVNLSAASMDVAVGSLANPKERQGLAHFLEHMLFLATKKYPRLDGYGEFLKAHGGYSNAFTAEDHTNYHFEVDHGALAEALDRFAQFFIAPVLDYRYAQREVKAVDGEHQKNLANDTWRARQVFRSLLLADHPANGFSTGNLQTLGDTQEAELVRFFEEHYGAGRMALCVVAKLGLDEQERLVRKLFGAIPARKQARPFAAPRKILERKQALRLVRVLPVKQMRQLQLIFPLPPQRPDDGSRSGRLVGMTLGDEGPGSLLSHLKQLGLATSLSAGVQGDTRWWGSCRITVGLTGKGLERAREVIQLCLGYLALLRKSPFPDHVWREMRTLSELEERWSPKGEGSDVAIRIASAANLIGLERAERAQYHFTAPDEPRYRALLGDLVAENMLCVLIGPGLATDRTEPWYGTRYSVVEQPAAYAELAAAALPQQVTLPRPNPFIPRQAGVLAERPVELVASPGMTLYYLQDTEFKRPKVSIRLHFLTPAAYDTPKSHALTQLHAALVIESLNEFAYPALVAGLSYKLQATRRGLLLVLGGYSDSALKLLEIIGKQLVAAEYPPALFAIKKEILERELRNFPLSQAYQVTSELSNALNLKRYHSRAALLAATGPLQPADLQAHVRRLFAASHIQALCHGNVSAPRIRRALDELSRRLSAKPFPREQAHEDEHVWLDPGEDQSYHAAGQTTNACLRIEHQVGQTELTIQAAAWILAQAVRQGFYTEMRTRQGLGYIVFSGGYDHGGVQKQVFLIQSAKHRARELFARADAFIATLPEALAKLPPKTFEAIRASLIQERKKTDKSIEQKAARFYDLAYRWDGDFDRAEREIAALRKVRQADVVTLARQAFGAKTRRRLVILLDGKQHGPDAGKTTIGEIAAFHRGRTFLRR